MENIIKKLKAIQIVTAILLLSACSQQDEINYFSSKEEALEHFIQYENVKGNIDMFTTVNDEILLVTEPNDSTYFVGELIEDKEGYYVKRISDNISITSGALWELETKETSKYTISIEKDKEDMNYIQLSSGKYAASIIDGHIITESPLSSGSVIKEVETVKNQKNPAHSK